MVRLHPLSWLALALALALAGACTEPPAGRALAQPVVFDPEECPELGCGTNSSVIDGLGFHELDWTGQTPSNGLRYVGATHASYPQVAFTTQVIDGELIAFAGALVLRGDDVAGLELAIEGPAGMYALRVLDRATADFWHVDPPRRKASTYHIVWHNQDDDRLHELCANPSYDGDLLGVNPYRVVLFEGDRIATQTLRVVRDNELNWVNVACGGTAPSKLFMSQYTYASRRVVPHSLAERTALLKLFTAHYCQAGPPFTFPGEPLRWARPGSIAYRAAPPPGALEARWDEHGAICLEDPRLAQTTNQDALDTYPDLAGAIQAACGDIPPCGTSDPAPLPGVLTSANY